jgi:hypothetical protein
MFLLVNKVNKGEARFSRLARHSRGFDKAMHVCVLEECLNMTTKGRVGFHEASQCDSYSTVTGCCMVVCLCLAANGVGVRFHDARLSSCNVMTAVAWAGLA